MNKPAYTCIRSGGIGDDSQGSTYRASQCIGMLCICTVLNCGQLSGYNMERLTLYHRAWRVLNTSFVDLEKVVTMYQIRKTKLTVT